MRCCAAGPTHALAPLAPTTRGSRNSLSALPSACGPLVYRDAASMRIESSDTSAGFMQRLLRHRSTHLWGCAPEPRWDGQCALPSTRLNACVNAHALTTPCCATTLSCDLAHSAQLPCLRARAATFHFRQD